MAPDRFNTFEKVKYGSEDYGKRQSRNKALSYAEQFNEPAVILEGPDEFVVLRGISWKARHTWAKNDLPTWAKDDPEAFLVATVYPHDNLKGHYRKAGSIVKRMQKKANDTRYEDRFDLEELCRDYPQVRSYLNIVEKQAEALYSSLVYVGMAVDDAVRDHKKNGQPKTRHTEEWGGEALQVGPPDS